MKSGFNLSEWALQHKSFVWYLTIVLVVMGLLSYANLGRNEDPLFTIKTMVVTAQWPGASIEDTLLQVTERLEKKLQEAPDIDYLKSYTTAGETTIFVNLKTSAKAETIPDTWYQVRKKISDVKHTLPQGVIGPNFDDEFGDTYGIIYAFTTDGFTMRQLRDYVEDARSRLLLTPEVAKIDILGLQDEKIYIEFSIRKLAGYGINLNTIVQALQNQNAVVPTGFVQTDNEKIIMSVSGGFQSEEDLKLVNLSIGSRMLPLRDIAEIKRGYVDPPKPEFFYMGKQAIGLAISMQNGGDIIALGENIKKSVKEITDDFPVGIESFLVAQQPDVVKHDVAEFMDALIEAVIIVLAISFVSLGLRAGAVVSCSIPVVLVIVFAVMHVCNIDLQRISLGALVIALGLLVDDAMITIEMMVAKLEEGLDKYHSAIFAYTATAFPMLTGTLVTAAGFMPVGFAQSSAGEYMFSLFAVIVIALIASWFVAVVSTPLIGVLIMPDQIKKKHGSEYGILMKILNSFLIVCMRLRKTTIIVTLLIFAISCYGMTHVQQQFFPSSDRPELLVDLQLPQNSTIYATRTEAVKMDEILKKDPDIVRWSSYVGQGAIRFYLPLDAKLPNNAFAQFVIVTKGIEERERVKARLEEAFATQFQKVLGRIAPLELGPPIGRPVQYRLSGPDEDIVQEKAYELSRVIAANPKIRNMIFDWVESARQLRVEVNQDQARLLGISSESLSRAINAVVSGQAITQVRDDIYLIDIVARANAEDRISLDTLQTLQVPLPTGKSVPLTQVASIEYQQTYPIIWRRNRLPTITIQADVTPDIQPATIVKQLKKDIENFNAQLPPAYFVEVGGTVEESGKSQASITAVLPLMFMLMTVFLMIQLQSVQRMILVLSVAPLGLIGVVAALLLSGKPMGFVAMLGVMALTGMIVRNSVILIDQIEHEIKKGKTPWDAVVYATMHRARPIFLTSAAASFGMIPIATTIFWGPMAYAIIGGLVIATILTLITLPALYCLWFRVEEPGR